MFRNFLHGDRALFARGTLLIFLAILIVSCGGGGEDVVTLQSRAVVVDPGGGEDGVLNVVVKGVNAQDAVSAKLDPSIVAIRVKAFIDSNSIAEKTAARTGEDTQTITLEGLPNGALTILVEGLDGAGRTVGSFTTSSNAGSTVTVDSEMLAPFATGTQIVISGPASVTVGQTSKLTATANIDGITEDISSTAIFTATPADIVELNSNSVTGLRAGTITVRASATLRGVEVTSSPFELKVVEPQAKQRSLRFVRQLYFKQCTTFQLRQDDLSRFVEVEVLDDKLQRDVAFSGKISLSTVPAGHLSGTAEIDVIDGVARFRNVKWAGGGTYDLVASAEGAQEARIKGQAVDSLGAVRITVNGLGTGGNPARNAMIVAVEHTTGNTDISDQLKFNSNAYAFTYLWGKSTQNNAFLQYGFSAPDIRDSYTFIVDDLAPSQYTFYLIPIDFDRGGSSRYVFNKIGSTNGVVVTSTLKDVNLNAGTDQFSTDPDDHKPGFGLLSITGRQFSIGQTIQARYQANLSTASGDNHYLVVDMGSHTLVKSLPFLNADLDPLVDLDVSEVASSDFRNLTNFSRFLMVGVSKSKLTGDFRIVPQDRNDSLQVNP